MLILGPAGERFPAQLTSHWTNPYRPSVCFTDARGRWQALERTPRPGWQLADLQPADVGALISTGYLPWVLHSDRRVAS